jgi:rhodanese-related sulfurtransferase
VDEQLLHYRRKLEFEIDARSREAFARQHISGAINLPHREMSRETTASIDRGTLVVVYCDGIGCNASTKGALKMLELGFRTKELIGGLDWWRRDGHPTETQRQNRFFP